MAGSDECRFGCRKPKRMQYKNTPWMCLKSIKQLAAFQNITTHSKEGVAFQTSSLGVSLERVHTLPQLGTPNVLVGFLAAWLLAASPTKRSAWDYQWFSWFCITFEEEIWSFIPDMFVPASVKATKEGVVRLPSAFSMICTPSSWSWLTLGKGMPKKTAWFHHKFLVNTRNIRNCPYFQCKNTTMGVQELDEVSLDLRSPLVLPHAHTGERGA